MGHLVPESRDTDFESVAIQGWNTGSVITYGKNYKTGYMETANVTVYQDSGIDNTAKLAHAVGSVAMGTGSVMQGVGSMRYANAMQDYASAYKKMSHDGFKYEITGDGGGSNVEVNGGTTIVNAAASAGASAEASAGASANAGGGGGGKGGHGGMGGGYGKPAPPQNCPPGGGMGGGGWCD
ncbi:MAG: hypothetical protein KDN20_03455 [Verrucomicrobiae bacterium]|nr:hypothetical protein [Verrucomicrobiae bacterium]